MRKIKWLVSFTLSIVLIPSLLVAQDQVVAGMKKESEKATYDDTTYKYNSKGWRKGGLVSLALAQGNSSNWAAGAEHSSFSISAAATLFANKRKGDFFWNNTLDLGYAMQKTSSQGSRKTNDKIDFYSKMGHQLNEHWAFAGVLNLRTQFTDGYEYDYLGKGLKRRTSGLFAPSYLLLSPGFEWKPAKYFNMMISPFSARWVIVTNDPYSYYYPDGQIPLPDGGQETPLSALYGVNAARKVSFEAGAYLSANFLKEVFKNVTYKSRVDFFSNYLSKADPITNEKKPAKPGNIDIFWTNTIAMKVNKWLSVTYNFDLIYDDDTRQFGPNHDAARVQVRSLLGVGFMTKL
ncbi:DUF3078 domain-containing protein [Flavihumibacter profundi]|uniref:DUF3078 domain-containing protein n=1 Tax=Flavihumibacter profundi TaxID=2716883 RepID=UPI001CC5DC67|nr:DUF3078 domain-containing protein [Flavihumibacter profundi]MBZ5858528.1 DUF3078 domain-containing protein [Flavihumibacter profundi]